MNANSPRIGTIQAVATCVFAMAVLGCSSGAGSGESVANGNQKVVSSFGACIENIHYDSGLAWHAQDDGTCIGGDDGICNFESAARGIIRDNGGDPDRVALAYSRGSDGNIYFALPIDAVGGDYFTIHSSLGDLCSQYPDYPVYAQVATYCAAASRGILTWDPVCPACAGSQ
jgi:hypothetical protein